MEHFKTGGGVPKIKNLSNLEENIISMLPSPTQGLSSVWDSDQVEGRHISLCELSVIVIVLFSYFKIILWGMLNRILQGK